MLTALSAASPIPEPSGMGEIRDISPIDRPIRSPNGALHNSEGRSPGTPDNQKPRAQRGDQYRLGHRPNPFRIRTRPFRSIPQIFLIVFDAVLREQFQILFLERLLLVVFVLPVDVRQQASQILVLD